MPETARVSLVHDTPPSPPDFTQWPSFPFEGELRVKDLDEPVPIEPPRRGEGHRECTACGAPDEAYIWVGERWRVRAMDRPTGLPMVLILESRSHLDLGDLPNLLAAELGVMTVRLERAIRSLDGVARVHVNRWGDGSAHLHLWFLARPHGQLQLRGTFLPLWDSILPPIPESTWRGNLAMVAAWLAEFGGRPLAEPPRIQWQAPASFSESVAATPPEEEAASASVIASIEEIPADDETPADDGEIAAHNEEVPADDGKIAAHDEKPTRETATGDRTRAGTAADEATARGAGVATGQGAAEAASTEAGSTEAAAGTGSAAGFDAHGGAATASTSPAVDAMRTSPDVEAASTSPAPGADSTPPARVGADSPPATVTGSPEPGEADPAGGPGDRQAGPGAPEGPAGSGSPTGGGQAVRDADDAREGVR